MPSALLPVQVFLTFLCRKHTELYPCELCLVVCHAAGALEPVARIRPSVYFQHRVCQTQLLLQLHANGIMRKYEGA